MRLVPLHFRSPLKRPRPFLPRVQNSLQGQSRQPNYIQSCVTALENHRKFVTPFLLYLGNLKMREVNWLPLMYTFR
jgi:hypothetical protein